MNTDHIIESLRPLACPIDSLKPDPRNARTHDKRNMEAIKASLQKFGQQQPILADAEGVVIAGNARLAAMKELGWTVAAVARTTLSGYDRRAYALTDNRTAELASWDFNELQTTFEELRAEDYSVDATGWNDIETVHLAAGDFSVFKGGPVVIASAAGKNVQVVEDESPAPMDVPATRPGDLWILGDHRLLCGDSGNPEHIDRLLAGAKIHLVNTDPPYNVKVEPRSNNAIAAGLSSFQATQPRAETHHQQLDLARHPEKAKATGKMRAKDRPLANDFMSDEAFDKCLDAWFGNIARVLVPGGGFYIWGGYANCANYPPFLKKHGLYFSQAVIWDKQHPVLTRKDFMGAHEWAFYGWKEGAAHRFFGSANIPDIWQVKKVNPQSMVHLTEKPVELAVRAMMYSSLEGENVLDLFGGSGSTLMGAEQTKRRAHLMELDMPYCDVIVQRWQNATKRAAVLEGDGRTYAEVSAERRAKATKAS